MTCNWCGGKSQAEICKDCKSWRKCVDCLRPTQRKWGFDRCEEHAKAYAEANERTYNAMSKAGVKQPGSS